MKNTSGFSPANIHLAGSPQSILDRCLLSLDSDYLHINNQPHFPGNNYKNVKVSSVFMNQICYKISEINKTQKRKIPMKRLSLVLVLAVALVTLFSPISSANALLSPWPECGENTITTGGEYTDANLSIVYGMDGSDDIVDFNSFNGWKIYHFVIQYNSSSNSANFPDGTTSDTAYISGTTAEITGIVVELKKDCSAKVECKPTDLYVYTLLGNYPCNLVTVDYPIPERFLNRQYTGPLCQLPDMEHQWNGKWIVNNVKDCHGYQVGGNYYNTSLPKLP
jgi:hypothetical protein